MLYGLLPTSLFANIHRQTAGGDPRDPFRQAGGFFCQCLPMMRADRNTEPAQTLAFNRVLQRAVNQRAEFGKEPSDSGDVLVASLPSRSPMLPISLTVRGSTAMDFWSISPTRCTRRPVAVLQRNMDVSMAPGKAEDVKTPKPKPWKNLLSTFAPQGRRRPHRSPHWPRTRVGAHDAGVVQTPQKPTPCWWESLAWARLPWPRGWPCVFTRTSQARESGGPRFTCA